MKYTKRDLLSFHLNAFPPTTPYDMYTIETGDIIVFKSQHWSEITKKYNELIEDGWEINIYGHIS